jgi:phosphoribosylformimino-5-aminoimidazole carboxamide ribotide isomerase
VTLETSPLFELIPVIDLKNGVVVHAQKGIREQYAPLTSVLTNQPDIFSVMDGFLSLYPFKTFYIADLNAITGQGNHCTLINDVLTHFPTLSFWLDTGIQTSTTVLPANGLAVLGSECHNTQEIEAFKRAHPHFILSLDFDKHDQFLGDKTSLTQIECWPQYIIVMTLARVGSSSGVDMAKLKFFHETYPQKTFIAAGGIGTFEDIEHLKRNGFKKILLASALHSGALMAHDIQTFMT